MSLTELEINILRLVAEGFTNLAIGNRLSISESTVKWRLKHVFKVLGARDRAHAVARGFQTGVLTLKPAGPRELQPHGSHAAAQRHRYHDEDLCAACLAGERERDRVRKREKRAKAVAA